MADKYIGRNDVIRICERLRDRNTENTDMAFALNWAIESISRIPAADVRPVVRCEDCDLWNDWDSAGRKVLGTYRCSCAEWSSEHVTVYTGPDDYCSRGERKCE